MEYKHEKCRRTAKVTQLLNHYSTNGWKLSSVTMGDLATRFEMIFEKDPLSTKRYQYRHEQCRRSAKVTKYLNEYAKDGWRLVFHVMGDMATRHELFFEKPIN